MFLRFLVLVAGISLATCVVQEITLFSEPDYGGDGIIFRSKRGSFLSEFESFVQSAKSFCATGLWMGHTSVNFLGTRSYSSGFKPTRYCSNGTLSVVKSLRYYGPSDTTTLSISLYKGLPSDLWGGEEVVVTTAAGTGFVPTAAVITGPSSWTLFPNPDFSGLGICLVGTGELNTFAFNSTTSPASVLRGCNSRKVSSYITLTE